MIKSFLLSVLFLYSVVGANAQNKYAEVTLPELMKKLQQKDANLIIVDVRTPGEYYDTSSRYQQSNIGHIKGAINIPLQDFRKNPATVHQLDAYRDKNIYVICSHSYRSRVVSNMLLDSGFTHVTNTRGGMTEFFRRYTELAPFEDDFYESKTRYKNIAPAQLLQQLVENKNPLLIAIGNVPKFSWDSLNFLFYKYYPSFKSALNFVFADSLRILELVQKEKRRPVVLFNTTNYGAAELAGWLTQKGIPDVGYLVGGIDMFYENLVNKNLSSTASRFLKINSSIHFMTPSFYCDHAGSKNTILIDLRHDTAFNKITQGAKYNFKHLKGAVNFFAYNGVQKFEQQFANKKTEYIFISENGGDGIEFADSLAKKGYQVSWLNGGLHEWEWYMNNVEAFKCMDYFVN